MTQQPGVAASGLLWHCCIAAPAADNFLHSKDSQQEQHLKSHGKQQQRHGWNWWRRRHPSSTDASKQQQQLPKQQQQQQLQHLPPPQSAANSAAGPGPSEPAKPALLPQPQPQPAAMVSALTHSSLTAAAMKQRSISSLPPSASVKVCYQQRTPAGIRLDNTGDSPSELHSDLRQQTTRSLSSSIACTSSPRPSQENKVGSKCSGDRRCGSCSCSCSSRDSSFKQAGLGGSDSQASHYKEPQQPGSVLVHSGNSSMNSLLVAREPSSISRSTNCTVDAAALSAVVSNSSSSSSGSSAPAAITRLPDISAAEDKSLTVLAAELAARQAMQGPAEAAGAGARLHQQTDVLQADAPPQPSGPVITDILQHSSSSISCSLPSNVQLQQLHSGISFRMLNSSEASSSSSILQSSDSASTDVSSPEKGKANSASAAAAAAAAAAASVALWSSPPASLEPRSNSSPFAQLLFQQSVADSLAASNRQQHQQAPSGPTTAGMATATTAAAAAAAGAVDPPPFSSSGGSGAAATPTFFGTAAASVSPFTPVASRKSTRISWGNSSVTFLDRDDVFEVLDPETSSACSGHRILRHSASASSLSSIAGSSSGTTAGGSNGSISASSSMPRLQQLRAAFSSGTLGSSLSLTTRPLSIPSEEPLLDTGSNASGAIQRFKSVLRRSTEQLSGSISFMSREGDVPTTSKHRRSKSANNIRASEDELESQQEFEANSVTAGAGAGSVDALAAVAGGRASASRGGGAVSAAKLLPPLPRTGNLSITSSSILPPEAPSRFAPGSSSSGHLTPASNSSGFSSSTGGGSSGAGGGGGGSSSTSNRLSAAAARDTPSIDSQSTCSSSAGSLASGGISGSLMATAVSRMHSDPPPGTAAAAAVAAATSEPLSTTSSRGDNHSALRASKSAGALSAIRSAHSSSLSAAVSSASSSCQAAEAFAQAFLAALAAGNTKWASDPAVAGLLHETAKMVGLDKQVYTGKTAIIRRLNTGMEQLVKMAEAHAADKPGNGSSNTSRTGSSSRLHSSSSSMSSMDCNSPAGDNAAEAAAVVVPAAGTSMSQLTAELPKPVLNVSCPDPASKPSLVVATYTFKWGLRKFTLKDEFIVKSNQVMRLRRTRN